MKYSIRSKTTGRFIPRKTVKKIVNGRLYDFNGAIVRAKKLCQNGLRFVSFHKTLNGFVPDSELKPIDKEAVRSYLERA